MRVAQLTNGAGVQGPLDAVAGGLAGGIEVGLGVLAILADGNVLAAATNASEVEHPGVLASLGRGRGRRLRLGGGRGGRGDRGGGRGRGGGGGGRGGGRGSGGGGGGGGRGGGGGGGEDLGGGGEGNPLTKQV